MSDATPLERNHVLDDPPPTERRHPLLPLPLFTLVLIVAWLLLVNSVHPRLILLGVAFSLAIALASHRFLPRAPAIYSWSTGFRFLPVFAWDIVVANVHVAWLIVRVWRPLRPTWLEIPLDMKDPFAMSALASVISLTPGTVSASFDSQRRVLSVHTLDTDDAAAEIARIKERYEAPLRRVFEP